MVEVSRAMDPHSGSSCFSQCGSGSNCFLNADPDPAQNNLVKNEEFAVVKKKQRRLLKSKIAIIYNFIAFFLLLFFFPGSASMLEPQPWVQPFF